MSIYKHALFVPAVSLLLLSMSFTFSEYGVAWFWSTQPIVGIVLFLTSIACTSAILLDWWSSKRKLDTH